MASGRFRFADELVVLVAGKVALRLEGILQLRPCTVQPHLGIASTYTKGLSDLIVRETAELPEHEHGPMLVRKLSNQSADAIPHFLADKFLLGRRLVLLRSRTRTWTARRVV